MKTILVVEDEARIAQIAKDYLERAGFAVHVAADGAAALREFRAITPDLIVLDLGLPDRDGLDVARDIRRAAATPIIMLTARGEETDRLVGLELGADDYMVKPFSPKELVARARAVLRRAEAAPTAPEQRVHAADLVLDPARMRVTQTRAGAERVIELTNTEFQLLAMLARQPGRVFTRAQLLDAVRGVAIESYERAIDAHIKNLRRKLGAQPEYIATVYGVGYKFVD
ncbi:MAG TPA: response regulator transcription factor [Thermoflexales bacterium]|nr:response regulator transcription factor [Thermoflexales bacterium]HQW35692.1 response regulator transcription factor [Thermoflexales bacterium]HQZ98590.1 response regulator transcription factor [Thermoflexales bacterium]